MLSLIVCSRDAKILMKLTRNVAATVGVPHEIVAVDNSQNQYGICEAYNVGAARAKYNLLCFLHEDLNFHTVGWGQVVANALADPTVGVLGVAGGQHQLWAPSSWWFPGEAYRRMQVLHTIGGRLPVLDIVRPVGESGLVDVAVLDGLWLCSRREVWAAHPFDAATFSGFHFYDVDYCTSIYFKFRICVTYDIMIEHFSTGSINQMWVLNCLKYHTKWQRQLPFGVVRVAPLEEALLEADAIYHFIDLLIWHKMPARLIYRWLGEAVRRAGLQRRALGVCKQLLIHRITR